MFNFHHLGVGTLVKVIIASAMLVVGSLIGAIPAHDIWFWAFWYYFLYKNCIAAVISGLIEPHEGSADSYVSFFRSIHALDHRMTPYALHKSFWPFFKRKEGRTDDQDIPD